MTAVLGGYQSNVTDPRLVDHATGIELEIVELVEQRERATAQGRAADAARLQSEIDVLYRELADTAERITAQAGSV